jgi:hypothetical protein
MPLMSLDTDVHSMNIGIKEQVRALHPGSGSILQFAPDPNAGTANYLRYAASGLIPPR